MKLIDISDLDLIVAQVNEQTIKDKEFLTQICPREPKNFLDFIKKEKKGFYFVLDQLANRILARILILQNRLYERKDWKWENKIINLSFQCLNCGNMNPKNSAAAYLPTRQELVNKALNGDEELTNRIKYLPWIKKGTLREGGTVTTKPYLLQPSTSDPVIIENKTATSQQSELNKTNEDEENTSPKNKPDFLFWGAVGILVIGVGALIIIACSQKNNPVEEATAEEEKNKR